MRPSLFALLLLCGCGLFGPVEDTRAPTVEITRPGAGAVVGGEVLLRVEAEAQGEGNFVSFVTVSVDGERAGEADLVSAPGEPAVFVYRLDSDRFDDGRHRLEATAFDRDDNRGLSSGLEVMFLNGVVDGVQTQTGPRAALISPREGERVSGEVQVVAQPELGQPPVTRVDFLIDGVGVATDAQAPFTYEWNTALEQPGIHTVQARVYSGSAFRLTLPTTVQVESAGEEGEGGCQTLGCVRFRRTGFAGAAQGGVAVGFNGDLYVGTTSDTLYAFTPRGMLRWKRASGGSAPLVSNSEDVFVAGGTRVFGFTALGDPVSWRAYDAGAVVTTALAIGTDGTLYFGDRDGRVHAVNSFTGRARSGWPVQLGGAVSQPPVVTRSGRIVVATGAAVTALESDGAEAWTRALAPVSGPLALAERDVQILTGTRRVTTVYVPTVQSELVALAAEDGEIEQRIATQGSRPGGPIVAGDGTIYVGTSEGLEALNADVSDGRPRVRFVVAAPDVGQPALDANGVVHFASGSTLRGTNPSGTPAFSYALGAPASGPLTIGRDGVLYAATGNQLLVALNTDSNGLAQGGWPMYQRNSRHTGRLGIDADDE
jgi:outer membrane protein assembly factor BamB